MSRTHIFWSILHFWTVHHFGKVTLTRFRSNVKNSDWNFLVFFTNILKNIWFCQVKLTNDEQILANLCIKIEICLIIEWKIDFYGVFWITWNLTLLHVPKSKNQNMVIQLPYLCMSIMLFGIPLFWTPIYCSHLVRWWKLYELLCCAHSFFSTELNYIVFHIFISGIKRF